VRIMRYGSITLKSAVKDATLEEATLEGVTLIGAYLSGADLSHATGITDEQLEQQATSLEGPIMADRSKHP
jgi:uncharacterized protein YjbI with pentapeptide repeats